MEQYLAVTTCSPQGYRLYGKRFVESFLENWTIPLVVFYETERPDISHPRLILRDLDLDRDRRAFMDRYDRPEFRGSRGDYATQAIRFSHKVFALTANLPAARWRIWLDADVETTAPVTDEILHSMCPADASLSYLGRQNGQSSETGFIACRPAAASVHQMLGELRRTYTSGALFELGPRHRHDGALFDRARAAVPDAEQRNLSMNCAQSHVWPHTVLGQVMTHWKGQVRKREAYGGTVAYGVLDGDESTLRDQPG